MDMLQGYLGLLFVILLLSSFVKVFTSLTILRYGVGMETAGFGVVIFALSFALSLLVINPQVQNLGGVGALFGSRTIAEPELEKQFRPFLEKHAHPDVSAKLSKVVNAQNPQAAAEKGQDSFMLLVSSFLVSELKEAFQLGFMLLIPFLVIDLIVANVLTVLGVFSLSQSVVALPFKILLFFAVDGWTLITEKLLSGY